MTIHNRGFGFLVPIGRSLTRQEEKNDVRLRVMLLGLTAQWVTFRLKKTLMNQPQRNQVLHSQFWKMMAKTTLLRTWMQVWRIWTKM